MSSNVSPQFKYMIFRIFTCSMDYTCFRTISTLTAFEQFYNCKFTRIVRHCSLSCHVSTARVKLNKLRRHALLHQWEKTILKFPTWPVIPVIRATFPFSVFAAAIFTQNKGNALLISTFLTSYSAFHRFQLLSGSSAGDRDKTFFDMSVTPRLTFHRPIKPIK